MAAATAAPSFGSPHSGLVWLDVAGLAALVVAALALVALWQRNRALRAAQHASDELRSGFLEATMDWVWRTDADYRLTYVSPQFVAQTGLTADDVLGRTPAELFFADDELLRTRHLDHVARRKPFREADFNHTMRNGSEHWYRINSVPLFDGNARFTGYMGTARDITAEVLSKRRLDENRATTNYLFDAAPDAIVYCLPDRTIVRVNPKFTKLFGYAPDEVIGRTTELLYVDREEYKRSGKLIFDADSDSSFEPMIWHMKRKDGTYFTAEVVASRVHNAAGEVIGNVGILRDITERETASAALLKAKEDAELANRSKSQFLAHMSHELRTPLNAILGFSEILKLEMHGALGDPRYAEYVTDIYDSGTLLLSMINDILDLSRIEAGKLELNEREIDIAAAIEESLRFLRERAERRGVSIQLGESVSDIALYADERLVKQMLLNLLSNAVKFTPPEGRITTFAAIEDDGALRLAVVDTGIGIAAADIDRVRKPFAQAHNVWHKTGDGAGIGLFLVDSLIQAHGGTMNIASEPNNGTIVTLRFPASRVHRIHFADTRIAG